MSILIEIQKNGKCTVQCESCGAIHKDRSCMNKFAYYRTNTLGCKSCSKKKLQGIRRKKKQKQAEMLAEMNVLREPHGSYTGIKFSLPAPIPCKRCHKKKVCPLTGYCDACLEIVNEYRHRMGHANFSCATAAV